MNNNYSFSQRLVKVFIVSLLISIWMIISASVNAGTIACSQQAVIINQSDTENEEDKSQDNNEDEDDEEEEPECD